MADTKQQWYKDAKYGLFIHWGLYSILAGEWKDPKTGEVTKTDRIAEWIENNLNIDKEDYRKLKDEFHPDKFDADMFVKRAKEQWGVKYIVLTSKHHEGFAMYDSKVSDFNVVKAAGRDILRELSDACKKYDMTMGIYYSQAQDWDDDNAYKKDYEDKDKIVKVRALDDGHEVPISNAWMHSDYPDIAFVDLGPDPVLPDPVDYVLEVEMAE